MEQLTKCISFWEALLLNKGLLSPSTATLVNMTIKYLKQLQASKEVISG